MRALDGRVAIITGAGRGIGRAHALLFAAEGARLVVNDVGGGADGSGSDTMPAQELVDQIHDMGGEAVADTDDVTDWEAGRRLIGLALETYGDLHVLVNNAGILRDRMLVNMAEDDWDTVVTAHLKGHFVPCHWAAEHWRFQAKAGRPVRGCIINTSSGAGLLGNIGQTNYVAAKAGIAAFTIAAAQELRRYDVRVNAVAPIARTRLTLQTPGMSEAVEEVPDAEFDIWDPANISPLVAYLAMADCPVNGGVFHVAGHEVGLMRQWTLDGLVTSDGRFTVAELAAKLPSIAGGELASVGTSMAQISQEFAQRHGAAKLASLWD